MTPLERYEATINALNALSQTVVDRFGATPTHAETLDAMRAERDAALKDRDEARAQRDEANSSAAQWEQAYNDFVAQAGADAERLCVELAPLLGDKNETAASQ